MSIVRTLTGDVSPDRLGITLCHEHLLTGPPQWAVGSDPDLLLDDDEKAGAELAEFAAAGGGAVVEMTTPDYGRDAARLAGIASAADALVIGASGYQKGTYYPDDVKVAAPDDLAARIVTDIRTGMDGTDARAGVIKFGSCRTDHLQDDETRVLEAVAAASLATGAPISTHTQAGTLGDVQLAQFLKHGVPASSVLIGHVDRNLDRGYLHEIAQEGAWLGFDHWTKSKYASDADRVSLLGGLLEAGHEQIMVAGDLGRPSYQRAHGGSPGLTGILEKATADLGPKVARLVFVTNPARFFAFDPR